MTRISKAHETPLGELILGSYVVTIIASVAATPLCPFISLIVLPLAAIVAGASLECIDKKLERDNIPIKKAIDNSYDIAMQWYRADFHQCSIDFRRCNRKITAVNTKITTFNQLVIYAKHLHEKYFDGPFGLNAELAKLIPLIHFTGSIYTPNFKTIDAFRHIGVARMQVRDLKIKISKNESIVDATITIINKNMTTIKNHISTMEQILRAKYLL